MLISIGNQSIHEYELHTLPPKSGNGKVNKCNGGAEADKALRRKQKKNFREAFRRGVKSENMKFKCKLSIPQ